MLARLSNSSHCLCVLRDRAYVLDEYGKLQAFDLSSGRRIWTSQLGPVPKESFGSGYLVATPAGLYASVDRSGEFGAKIEDGKVLWTRQFEHQTVYPPVAIGNDVITSQSGLKRIRIRTGDAVWSAASEYWSFLVADVVISDGRQGMTGRNASTGEILWRHPTPDPALSTVRYAYTPDAGPDSIWLDGEVKFCFKKDGTEIWRSATPYSGWPVYTDGNTALTVDIGRILCYEKGTLAPLPEAEEERRALAVRLASQVESLDTNERKQLEALVPYSFQPLLARYGEWARDEVAQPENSSRFHLYHRLNEMTGLLEVTCRKADTEALVKTWGGLRSSSHWRADLERVMEAKGDPSVYVPFLIKDLRRSSKSLPYNSTEWIKIFPYEPSIRLDSDGDGLTDLVEARLGTDPNNPDTDGDGLTDAVDLSPNAAPRPRGDKEKIVAACIEAPLFLEGAGAPSVLTIDGMQPFQLNGNASTFIWGQIGKASALMSVYGGGMVSIHFSGTSKQPKGEFITFDPDGKTAHTFISHSSGGRSGSGSEYILKKIGDDWFVVDVKLIWVS